DLVGDACDMCRVDGDKLAAVIQGSYGAAAPATKITPDAPVDAAPTSVVEAQPSESVENETAEVQEVLTEHPEGIPAPDAAQDEPAVRDDAQDDEEESGPKGRRGYRGLRG
ncbi:hypothetical protein, partial [Pseudomonas aeruginosa]|uniref:hypothetical protein n=1 Tax=Pseudomonas aeruginosa TaxID=287 RepID=UPI0031B74F04